MFLFDCYALDELHTASEGSVLVNDESPRMKKDAVVTCSYRGC